MINKLLRTDSLEMILLGIMCPTIHSVLQNKYSYNLIMTSPDSNIAHDDVYKSTCHSLRM